MIHQLTTSRLEFFQIAKRETKMFKVSKIPIENGEKDLDLAGTYCCSVLTGIKKTESFIDFDRYGTIFSIVHMTL